MILYQDFYPRPPRGGRRDAVAQKRRLSHFYPRPPRGGRRPAFHRQKEVRRFLSTPSARRATFLMPQIIRDRPISIHALREEGDVCRYSPSHSHPYFYPRPPRGGRLVAIEPKDSGRAISIHALREEGDQLIYRGATQVALFLSTPSARRATRPLCPVWPRRGISIHALREEGDTTFMPRLAPERYFYPRPPRGGRPAGGALNPEQAKFLSTPSARRATGQSTAIICS